MSNFISAHLKNNMDAENFKQSEVEEDGLKSSEIHLNRSKKSLIYQEFIAGIDELIKAAEAAGIKYLLPNERYLTDSKIPGRLISRAPDTLDNPHSQSNKRSLDKADADGDVDTIKKLLLEGLDIHETTEEEESLLSLACLSGCYEIAKVLLALNVNVDDGGTEDDRTPLMEAAGAGHANIVSLLIAHGANVNAKSKSDDTPLMYACAGGHEDVVKILLEAGAKIEVRNENGYTTLMETAKAGHVPVAKVLLEHGADINIYSNDFYESALTLASYEGHSDMVKFLLESGADIEYKTEELTNALMEASIEGHVEAAQILLDAGAEVDGPTDGFESSLTLAACGGHVDLGRLLIERGANIERFNDEGYTPLMEAARKGYREMVELLLEKGADINAQAEETQETALTLACSETFIDELLMNHKTDTESGESTAQTGKLPASKARIELVEFLLEKGADVNALTAKQETALTLACAEGYQEVVELLIEKGADIELGAVKPAIAAARNKYKNIVALLIDKLKSR